MIESGSHQEAGPEVLHQVRAAADDGLHDRAHGQARDDAAPVGAPPGRKDDDAQLAVSAPDHLGLRN